MKAANLIYDNRNSDTNKINFPGLINSEFNPDRSETVQKDYSANIIETWTAHRPRFMLSYSDLLSNAYLSFMRL